MARLNDNTRTELKDFMRDQLISNMFGDGLEDDYVNDGFPTDFKGLNNMDDQELIDLALTMTGEDEELIVRARAELAISQEID